MTWTIAKKNAGYLVSETRALELSPFDVLVFQDVDAPAPGLVGVLREQLPGTGGYFQIEGEFNTYTGTAIEEGQELMLRFESRGAKLEVGIDVQGQVKTVVPPGKKPTETSQQYDFTVKREVYISEDD